MAEGTQSWNVGTPIGTVHVLQADDDVIVSYKNIRRRYASTASAEAAIRAHLTSIGKGLPDVGQDGYRKLIG